MAYSCATNNSGSVPIFKSLLENIAKFYLYNFPWHFPDELSMHFLSIPVLFKFFCFLFFKFFTRYSVVSVDVSAAATPLMRFSPELAT